MGRLGSGKPFQTKEEFVLETLRDAILDLRLAPGEKLVADRLSAEMGVSPIPLRGALQRLEAEGLVRIVPFSGAVVAEVTPQEVDEVFAVLEALEQVAVQAAARALPGAGLDELEELLVQMDQAAANSDYDAWSALNRGFHLALSEMSGMKLVVDFTRRALDRWERLRRYFFRQGTPARMAEAQREHHAVVELLRLGKVDDLMRLISAHNRAARETYHISGG